MLIYIAVPTTGWIRHELAQCLRQISHDTRYELLFPEANPLTRPSPCARHWIINGFLDCGADYLLMMDSDAVPYSNPLDLVELDLDIVAMACPIWRPGAVPPIVLNARPLDDSKRIIDSRSDGPLLEVAQVSTSVILIARRVLEHPDMRNPFGFQYNEDGITAVDDDVTFYRKARDAGFRVWVSLEHICGHMKEVDIAYMHSAVKEWR